MRPLLSGTSLACATAVVLVSAACGGDELTAWSGSDPTAGFDPAELDHDADGLSDAVEAVIGTDPVNPDTDSDGLDDDAELSAGSLPTEPDTDGDGLLDGQEQRLGTSPTHWDTDGDTLSDGEEEVLGTGPTVLDTDGDGIGDGEEQQLGTSPALADTDGDGLSDGVEVAEGTLPTVADTDGDSLDDGAEAAARTDPASPDTDGDGSDDGEEASVGSDPLDPFSWDFGSGRWPDFSDAAAMAGLAGTQYATGQTMPDFTAFDQAGRPVSLYQFYGYVVLVAIMVGFCPYCQRDSEELPALWERHREQGLMILELLLNDDVSTGFAGQSFRAQWAQDDGIEFPVLGEGDTVQVRNGLLDAGLYERFVPYYMLLDRQLSIDSIYPSAGQNYEPRIIELLQ
jgi:hypothetical protein